MNIFFNKGKPGIGFQYVAYILLIAIVRKVTLDVQDEGRAKAPYRQPWIHRVRAIVADEHTTRGEAPYRDSANVPKVLKPIRLAQYRARRTNTSQPKGPL